MFIETLINDTTDFLETSKFAEKIIEKSFYLKFQLFCALFHHEVPKFATSHKKSTNVVNLEIDVEYMMNSGTGDPAS